MSQIKETTQGIQKALESLSDSSKPLNKEAWAIFTYIRSEIRHEHDLLSGRVAWFITCQSFLLTTYAISYSNAPGSNWFSTWLLPILGVVISGLSIFMIYGSTQTIEMWADLRKSLINEYPVLDPLLIPRWKSSEAHNDLIHSRALMFPMLAPLVFIIAWVAIWHFSETNPWRILTTL